MSVFYNKKELVTGYWKNMVLKKIYAGNSLIFSTDDPQPANEIWYTSSDGEIVVPYDSSVFGSNIISNTYNDGKGIIKFDDEVLSIGDYAFQYCNLKRIIIPDSVSYIGDYAFYDCRDLAYIKMHDSISTIGTGVFQGCNLYSVIIPDSVISIGDYAFSSCTNLVYVECKSATPAVLGSHAFAYNAANRKIKVPPESVTTYKTATNWSTYASSII